MTPNPDAADGCAFLEGRSPHYPWNRACICEHRSSGKSTKTLAYVLWRATYIDSFSAKIIQNSFDNAKVNYTMKISALFKESDRAGYLQWLYEDRLRPGFEGCNQSQFWFKAENPLKPPSISVWGLESKFESWHGDLIVLDDPEGADAEKSNVGNEESWQAYQRAVPLLSDAANGQILVVATPHGNRPLVYRLRDLEQPPWQQESDNKRTVFKFYWKPLTDGSSNASRWPERFPPHVVEDLRRQPASAQNFWLRRKTSSEDLFDMKEVVKSFYSFAPGDRRLINYPGFEFDPDQVSPDGFVKPIPKLCEARVATLRFYLHLDPLHKTAETRRTQNNGRPSRAAIAVVGVAPDRHAFMIDSWSDDAPIEKQAEKLYWFYRKYGPSLVTYESIGAQAWLPSLVETWERMNPFWGQPKGFGDIVPPGEQLPRMSTRMISSEKDSTLSKDYLWREILSPWVNRGLLHFREDQDEIRNQLAGALDEGQPVDLLDCLAQGPILTEIRKGQAKRLVWQPPTAEHLLRDAVARRRWVEIVTGGVHKLTGYRPTGWRSHA